MRVLTVKMRDDGTKFSVYLLPEKEQRQRTTGTTTTTSNIKDHTSYKRNTKQVDKGYL